LFAEQITTQSLSRAIEGRKTSCSFSTKFMDYFVRFLGMQGSAFPGLSGSLMVELLRAWRRLVEEATSHGTRHSDV
jgi:hypothetical protein